MSAEILHGFNTCSEHFPKVLCMLLIKLALSNFHFKVLLVNKRVILFHWNCSSVFADKLAQLLVWLEKITKRYQFIYSKIYYPLILVTLSIIKFLAFSNYYRKNQRISRTFLSKIFAQNQGCGLSAGTSAIGYHILW